MNNKKELKKIQDHGSKLLKNKEHTKIISLTEKWIKQFPNEPQLFNIRGLAYLRENKTNNARIQFTKAKKLNPKISRYWHNIGVSYLRDEKYEKAIPFFKKAIKLNPKKITYYEAIGTAYFFLNQKTKFKQAILEGIKRKPTTSSLGMLSDFYFQRNEIKKYEEIKRKLLSIKPKNTEDHFVRGIIYDRDGKYEKAIKEFKKVTELAPKNILGWIRLGESWLRIDPKKSILMFRTAQKINPKDARTYAYLAQSYGIMKNYDLEIENCKKGLKLDSKNPMLWFLYGQAQQNTGKTLESIKSFKNSIKYNPDVLMPWIALVHAYLKNKKYAQAEKCVNKAIKIDPAHPSTLRVIMDIFPFSKERKPKLNLLKKLVEQKPSDLLFRVLGYALIEDKKFKEFLDIYEKRFSLNKLKDPVLLDLMGIAYMKTSNQLAQRYFEKSIQNNSSRDIPWSALADLQITAKNMDLATSYLIIAISLNPSMLEKVKRSKKYSMICKSKRFIRMTRGL